MKRRVFLIAGTALALRADDAGDIWDLFTNMASALSDDRPDEFMAAFDRAMPGYHTLEMDVTALVTAYEARSSIELVSEEGDSLARRVELDWFLEIVEKQDTGGVTRRREVVRCRLMKEKKKWRINSFEPLSFFSPPKSTQ
jgi:hypothetical protein